MHQKEKLYLNESRPSWRKDRPVTKKLNKTKGCAPATRLHCITRRPRIAWLVWFILIFANTQKVNWMQPVQQWSRYNSLWAKRPQGGSWQITLDRRERGSKKGEHSLPGQGNMFQWLADTKIKPTTFLQVTFFFFKNRTQLQRRLADSEMIPGRQKLSGVLLQGSGGLETDWFWWYFGCI